MKLINNYEPYYRDKQSALYLADTFEFLQNVKSESIDMIFADPPYFLSNGGISCQNGKMVSVDKGNWDKISTLQKKYEFNRLWIRECRRILKPNGTIWVSGTLHNIYVVGMALEEEEFKILNNITWQKKNPPPNLSCRYFTHSTETILWVRKNDKKAKHIFNYNEMKKINGGTQMKDVWLLDSVKKEEKKYGKHPTQKPVSLLELIIRTSTNKKDIVLDPFCGSSTTGVACKMLGRYYIGVDKNKSFIKLSKERLSHI